MNLIVKPQSGKIRLLTSINLQLGCHGNGRLTGAATRHCRSHRSGNGAAWGKCVCVEGGERGGGVGGGGRQGMKPSEEPEVIQIFLSSSILGPIVLKSAEINEAAAV